MHPSSSLLSRFRFGPALLALSAPAFLFFGAPRAVAADAPINVTIRSDEESLAKGFESAFRDFKPSPVYLTYQREDRGVFTLSGLRSVKASGAVLVITLDRGVTFVIPARSVIFITDERPNG